MPHLGSVAAELLVIISTLELKESGAVTPEEIRCAARRWAERPHRGQFKSAQLSYGHFVNVATKWLRFLGRLQQPTPSPKPYAPYLSDFASFMQEERGLSPASICSHCWKTSQFLAWLFDTNCRLDAVTVAHVEAFLISKGDSWNRKSVSTAAQALRAFFRHAELRGWCQHGIASLIEGPRRYRKDGLPDGPTWEEVCGTG